MTYANTDYQICSSISTSVRVGSTALILALILQLCGCAQDSRVHPRETSNAPEALPFEDFCEQFSLLLQDSERGTFSSLELLHLPEHSHFAVGRLSEINTLAQVLKASGQQIPRVNPKVDSKVDRVLAPFLSQRLLDDKLVLPTFGEAPPDEVRTLRLVRTSDEPSKKATKEWVFIFVRDARLWRLAWGTTIYQGSYTKLATGDLQKLRDIAESVCRAAEETRTKRNGARNAGKCEGCLQR